MKNFNELDFSGLNETISRFAELSKLIQPANDNAKILAQLISDGLKNSIESANKSADSSDNSDKDTENLSKRQAQILSVMENGKEYTTENIAALIELKGPRTRQLMKELAELGKVESLGTTKDRRYKK